MRRIGMLLLCGLLMGSIVPTSIAPVQAQATAACTVTTFCIYLPGMRKPDYAPFVQFVGTEWISGASYYPFQTCVGVAGAIQSATTQPAYDITVEARFLDATNHLIGTGSGTTALRPTYPDKPNYFTIRTPTPFSCSAPPRVELVVTRLSSERPANYRPLTVVSFRECGKPDEGSLAHVTIRNDNREPVQASVVALRIVGYRYNYFTVQRPGTLEPGATDTHHEFCDDVARGDPSGALGAEGIVGP